MEIHRRYLDKVVGKRCAVEAAPLLAAAQQPVQAHRAHGRAAPRQRGRLARVGLPELGADDHVRDQRVLRRKPLGERLPNGPQRLSLLLGGAPDEPQVAAVQGTVVF